MEITHEASSGNVFADLGFPTKKLTGFASFVSVIWRSQAAGRGIMAGRLGDHSGGLCGGL
jgi:hypothetical protein